jgi:hypothetical protein
MNQINIFYTVTSKCFDDSWSCNYYSKTDGILRQFNYTLQRMVVTVIIEDFKSLSA